MVLTSQQPCRSSLLLLATYDSRTSNRANVGHIEHKSTKEERYNIDLLDGSFMDLHKAELVDEIFFLFVTTASTPPFSFASQNHTPYMSYL